MNNSYPGFAVVLIIAGLSACSAEAPEPPTEPQEQSSATREASAQLSMEGAICALAPTDADESSWSRNYELRGCLRELAYANWPQAKAEATHIAAWSIEHPALNEVTNSLVRYESSAAIGADLEGRGLLGGPGAEYFEEDKEDGWQPVTVKDWLRQSGHWYEFDAETGTFPNSHDYLLEALAAMFGESLEAVTFVETAPDDWKSEAPYHVRAELGERSWEREMENFGDWYDVGAVLDMLNGIAADLGSTKRIMGLETYDQYVTVIVGPGESLLIAANEGLVNPALARGSMDRGKAFEEKVRQELGL